MRNAILILHIVTSILACIVTMVIVTRAIIGLIKKKSVSKFDVSMPLWTTVLLYVQLALGTALFIFYMVDYANGEIDLLKKSALRSRFWAVEHFILMVFTLVVSHIGWVFAKNGKTPSLLYKKNLLYFGIACAMIMVSMAMNVIKHAL
ncbi:hypothetical protein [Carboxylicivirga sp. N1Y90]|uniref:hypothetical protein n=1 Tax=Carboxylicivirga fragile TaxID=3417571 RepID=UPI003D32E863|nr:hypothetical protein [Marinilabiliaceae bacterium N1Y90]